MTVKITRKSYTAAQKLHVVDFAEHNGNVCSRHAGKQFNADEKLVRDCRRNSLNVSNENKWKQCWNNLYNVCINK